MFDKLLHNLLIVEIFTFFIEHRVLNSFCNQLMYNCVQVVKFKFSFNFSFPFLELPNIFLKFSLNLMP